MNSKLLTSRTSKFLKTDLLVTRADRLHTLGSAHDASSLGVIDDIPYDAHSNDYLPSIYSDTVNVLTPPRDLWESGSTPRSYWATR
jgi:hypothetical protein